MSSLRQCVVIDSVIGGMPAAGEYESGTMPVCFRGTVNTWGIEEGTSKGAVSVYGDVKSIRPISPTSSVDLVEVYSWNEGFEDASKTCHVDRDTEHGHIPIS